MSDSVGGGSSTAFPVIEIQASDVSAYIMTSVISSLIDISSWKQNCATEVSALPLTWIVYFLCQICCDLTNRGHEAGGRYHEAGISSSP